MAMCLSGCASPALSLQFAGGVAHVVSKGQPFATVHTTAEPRPYIWPLYAPGQVAVTRNHPMASRDGEQSDHPHHQSMWLAHGSVNGFDFWHGKQHRERVVVVETVARSGTKQAAIVASEYLWLVDDNTKVMEETRRLRFSDEGDVRTVDVFVEFRAAFTDVTFGDTKEGMFALRLHPALRVDGKVATGLLRNSEGHEGKGVWGKRARWIDNSGVVDGSPVGVTMMDHPQNHSFPTWWHARSYGLLAANPFGVHDFERKPAGTGDLVLKKGEYLSFRYRVLLHGDDWDDARLEAAYSDWLDG